MLPATSYQLIILGSGAAEFGARIEADLRARLRDIGDHLEDDLRVLRPAEVNSLTRTMPAVAVYFGGDESADVDAVDELLRHSIPILPVVDDLKGYTSKTPSGLHGVNGMAIGTGTADLSALVSVVLENLSLLRRTRRLFLSYFRADSTPVAHQLRVAFDDAGYDAFLDTSSVPKGDDFQSVLTHRLLDSDVMVVLDTEHFLDSRWTQFELAEASAMGVGLLRVVWPGVDRVRKAELAEHVYLDGSHFVGDQLTADAVTMIASAAERLRARCIGARHTNLVEEFCDAAAQLGAKTAVQPGRYVLAQMPDGRRIAAIPAVGVPDARHYHEASARFPAGGDLADEAVLLYNDSGMLSSWRQFLDWLDDHLPVRGMRVTETATRLGATR